MFYIFKLRFKNGYKYLYFGTVLFKILKYLEKCNYEVFVMDMKKYLEDIIISQGDLKQI